MREGWDEDGRGTSSKAAFIWDVSLFCSNHSGVYSNQFVSGRRPPEGRRPTHSHQLRALAEITNCRRVAESGPAPRSSSHASPVGMGPGATNGGLTYCTPLWEYADPTLWKRCNTAPDGRRRRRCCLP